MCHKVLIPVSRGYPFVIGRFLTCYSPVRYFPFNLSSEESIINFSFNLHVLSTPPAFVLSQDQTLKIKFDLAYIIIFEIINSKVIDVIYLFRFFIYTSSQSEECYLMLSSFKCFVKYLFLKPFLRQLLKYNKNKIFCQVFFLIFYCRKLFFTTTFI